MQKATSAILRKEISRTTGVKNTTTELDRRDQLKNTISKPIKFEENGMKMEGWQREQLEKSYEWKMLMNLLSNDPVP